MIHKLLNDWPSDLDHCIADETSLTEIIVVGERAYTVPRDVAKELERLRQAGASASQTNRDEILRLRQLLLALGGCFHRHEGDGGLVFNYPENTRLKFILGKIQETEFKSYVAI